MDRIQVFLGLVSFISSVLSIIGALRARHDRMLRALAYGLLAVASVGFCAYLVVSAWRDFRTDIAAREEALRARAERNEKAVATLLADNQRKEQRIAQLETQLGTARAGGTDGKSLRTFAPLDTPNVGGGVTCPLNDTWECAETLALGGQDSDEFRASDRERYYYVDLTAARAFTVTVDPVPGGGVTVSIHDPLRRELNRALFSRPGSLDTRGRAAGRYYIKMQRWSLHAETPQRYTITLAS